MLPEFLRYKNWNETLPYYTESIALSKTFILSFHCSLLMVQAMHEKNKFPNIYFAYFNTPIQWFFTVTKQAKRVMGQHNCNIDRPIALRSNAPNFAIRRMQMKVALCSHHQESLDNLGISYGTTNLLRSLSEPCLYIWNSFSSTGLDACGASAWLLVLKTLTPPLRLGTSLAALCVPCPRKAPNIFESKFLPLPFQILSNDFKCL